MITTKQIIKSLGNKNLSLFRGNGYFYFAYDDGIVFETESVYTKRLNDLTLDMWIDTGKSFLSKIL